MPHRLAAPPDAAAGTTGVLRGAVRLFALVAPISAAILAMLALLTGDGSLLAWSVLGVALVITSVAGSGPSDIVVDLPRGLLVFTDAARVRQVIRNLVGNAIRYGAAPIVVRADGGEDAVRVVVSDRGPEIPDSTAFRMFDAFFSGGEASGHQPGSIGLGLAVSQRLARLMGGDLRYARIGDETQFVLELPTVDQAQMRKSA